jgi:hypothetical protein
LLSRLSDRARQADIHRFTALVAAENVAAAGLARKLGACLVGRGPGTVEYEVALVAAEYSLDWWFGCVDDLAQPVREGRQGEAGSPADAGPRPAVRRTTDQVGEGGCLQPPIRPPAAPAVVGGTGSGHAPRPVLRGGPDFERKLDGERCPGFAG